MSLQRRFETGELQTLAKAQGKLGDVKETWETSGSIEVVPTVLSGQLLTQMSAKFEDTSYLLLTKVHGLQTEVHRILLNGKVFEPTFVNDAGRLAQVFCRVREPK